MQTSASFVLASLALSIVLTGCANSPTASEEASATVEKSARNVYPTRDLVDYVLSCVAKHGGLSYINQYACGCKIDKIAEQLTFEEFDAAKTYGQLANTTGEKASLFRTPKQAKDFKERLKKAEQDAEKACFVK